MSVEKLVGFVFSGVGVAVITGGVFWAKNSWEYSNRAVKVNGQLIDQLTEVCESTSGSGSSRRTTTYTCYRPVVKYKIAGETHESNLSETSSQQYSESDTFELYVDPQKPKEASTAAGLFVGPLFLLVFGGVFAMVGGFLLRSWMRRARIIKELEFSGSQIQGKVIYCGPNRSISKNGRNPWVVEAQWVHPSSGKTIVAKTLEELWYDPAVAGLISQDGMVEVRYNPMSPDKCMVCLPKVSNLKAG